MGKASRRKKERRLQATSEAEMTAGRDKPDQQTFHYILYGKKPWTLNLDKGRDALLLFSESARASGFMEDVGIPGDVASYPAEMFKGEAGKFVKRGITTALVDRSAFGGPCTALDLENMLATPVQSDGDLTKDLRNIVVTGVATAFAENEERTPVLGLNVPRWWLTRMMVSSRGCYGLIDMDTEGENAFAGVQLINKHGWPRASAIVDSGDNWGDNKEDVHKALLIFAEALRESGGRGIVLFLPDDGERPDLRETVPLDVVGVDHEILGQESVFSEALQVVWEAEKEKSKDLLLVHLDDEHKDEGRAWLLEAPIALALTIIQSRENPQA